MSGSRRSFVRPMLFGGRRLRHRPLQLVLLVVPLVIAGGLIGASSLVGALALEDSVHTRLAAKSPADRSLVVEYRLEPRAQNPELARHVRRTLASFRSISLPPAQVQVWDPIAPSDQRGVRLVLTDKPVSVAALAFGRLPRSCRGRTCEGLAISGGLRLGRLLDLGKWGGKQVRLKIVGVGALGAQTLPDQALVGGNAVLVPSVSGPLSGMLSNSSSTVSQSAVLDPPTVHAARLASLGERMRITAVRLERADPSVTVLAPTGFLQGLAHLGAVARNRLLLVASEAAALMIAFAAFIAASGRRDVDRLRLQLETLGASRKQIALARAAEVALPTLLALALLLMGLRIALVPIASARNVPASFAVPLSTWLSIAGLELVALVILFAAAVPVARRRFGIGALELAALTALGVIVWQAAATGGLDPNQIASGSGGLPVLLLTPALAVLFAGVVLLRLLPFLFRLAERLARGAPTAVRLALLAAARSPGQAAATTTFLAVALGSALFGLNYRATLEHQANATAAFDVGAVARATANGPLGTADASSVLRRDPSGTPALRLSGTVDQGVAVQQPVTILALPADRISRIVGWQARFSSLTRPQIAKRLRPRPITLTGPQLPPRTSAVRLWARDNSSAQRSVVLHLLQPGQGFATLALGQLGHSWRLFHADVPASLAGARLIGVEFPVSAGATSVIVMPGGLSGNVTASKEAVDFGALAAKTSTGWQPLPSLANWSGAHAPDFEGIVLAHDFHGAPIVHGVHYLLSGTSVPLIRPPVALQTTGSNSAVYTLPALAGPVPAGLAVDRQLTVDVLGQQLRLDTTGRASLFPTITTDPQAFLVIDYQSLLAALNADQPGLAPPSEAWFLRQTPSRTLPGDARVLRLEQERKRQLEDPLASGTRRLLTWSGYLAAALALLGLALSIRLALAAERRVLAEYEALGIAPRTLGVSMQLRLVFLCLLGLIAALAGAAIAVRLVAALVAVTGTGRQPLPPITTTIAWQTGGLLLIAVAAGAILAATTLVGRSLREGAGQRLRQ